MLVPKCIYPKSIFAKCTRLACLLSFASLLMTGALFGAKFTSVPKLGGGGVKPILAMRGFWDYLYPNPLS